MFASNRSRRHQTLTKVDLRDNRDAVIVSTSIGLALLVILKPGIVVSCPPGCRSSSASGVTPSGSLSGHHPQNHLLFFHIGRPGLARSGLTSTRWIATVRHYALDVLLAHVAGRACLGICSLRLRLSCVLPSRMPCNRPAPRRPRRLIIYTDVVSLILDGAGDRAGPLGYLLLSVGEVSTEEAEELHALAAAYRESLVARWSSAWTTWWTASTCCPRAGAASSTPRPPRRLACFALGEVIDIADLHFRSAGRRRENPMRRVGRFGFERL